MKQKYIVTFGQAHTYLGHKMKDCVAQIEAEELSEEGAKNVAEFVFGDKYSQITEQDTFNCNGGYLLYGGRVYLYITIDEDEESITCGEPMVSGHYSEPTDEYIADRERNADNRSFDDSINERI